MSDIYYKDALFHLLDVVEAAIKSGDWKVDGACDPDSAIHQAKEAMKHTRHEGWVSVDERLPEGGVVLVWTKNGDSVFCGFYKHHYLRKYLPEKYKEKGSEWYSVYPLYSGERVINCEYKPLGREVTHWMPLPLPPGEQQ